MHLSRRLRTLVALSPLLFPVTLGGLGAHAGTPVDPLAAPLHAAQKSLRAALAHEFPAAEIEVRQEDGPFETVIAVAAYPKAYPGTGVMRVALDRKTGASYGAHGQHTLADFAREHGWLAKPPAADELLRFVNTLLFEGVAIFDDQPTKPVVQLKDGQLVLETVRRWMPSNEGEVLVVTIGASGPEVVGKRALK